MKSKRKTRKKSHAAVSLVDALFRRQLPKGAFNAPLRYWIASFNEFIEIEEINVVVHQYVDPKIMPYCIYGLTRNIAQALNERYELKGVVAPELPKLGFAIVDNKTKLALTSFDDLEHAKAYVLTLSPKVKVFRTNSLELKVEEPNYLDLPAVDADFTRQDWIDYFLNKENDHSFFAAVSEDGVYEMLERLVAFGAPKRILNDFCENYDLSKAIDFTRERQLPAYQIGLSVAMNFEQHYSRFEGNNGGRHECEQLQA
ncbi:hypothetical protein TUM4438_46270 [Shewanella sairae]|uniref:Uncharacterized protein n=1 Tax=Shewanella sairae TaxID=190310 RepID=A0ABQ4PS65_9GAMM|nr:hypothetical protein [Shewanella sairae]MCL1132692.1 hypothetical protein [Shewanella sairae]GIU52782.1 hypothetical protein TUM4438_46270 [Shewanella sairae]